MDPTNATGGSIDRDLSLLVTSPTMVSIQASFSCNMRLGLVMGSTGRNRGSFGGLRGRKQRRGPGKLTEVIRRRGWVIKPRENAEHGETTYVESSIFKTTENAAGDRGLSRSPSRVEVMIVQWERRGDWGRRVRLRRWRM